MDISEYKIRRSETLKEIEKCADLRRHLSSMQGDHGREYLLYRDGAFDASARFNASGEIESESLLIIEEAIEKFKDEKQKAIEACVDGLRTLSDWAMRSTAYIKDLISIHACLVSIQILGDDITLKQIGVIRDMVVGLQSKFQFRR